MWTVFEMQVSSHGFIFTVSARGIATKHSQYVSVILNTYFHLFFFYFLVVINEKLELYLIWKICYIRWWRHNTLRRWHQRCSPTKTPQIFGWRYSGLRILFIGLLDNSAFCLNYPLKVSTDIINEETRRRILFLKLPNKLLKNQRIRKIQELEDIESEPNIILEFKSARLCWLGRHKGCQFLGQWNGPTWEVLLVDNQWRKTSVTCTHRTYY